MTEVYVSVQTAISKATQEVELLLTLKMNDQTKVFHSRAEVAEHLATELVQKFADPHNGAEVTVSLGDDRFPMLPQPAMTLALLLVRAAETAKSENVFKRFLSEQVELGEEEAVAMLRQFREFSARMAEDQFYRFG